MTPWLTQAFDPSLVNQMNVRNSWDLVVQRKLSSYCGSVVFRQLNPTHIRGP